jgi:hypothetical protein
VKPLILNRLTRLINFERENEQTHLYQKSLNQSGLDFESANSLTEDNRKNKRKDRSKNQLEYDKRIADNIVKTKYPQTIYLFTNSSIKYDQQLTNSIFEPDTVVIIISLLNHQTNTMKN